MVSINDLVFGVSLLVYLGISGFALWNIFSAATKYELKITVLLFISQIITYLFMLIVVMTDYTYISYSVMFTFVTFLMPFVALFFIIDLFLRLSGFSAAYTKKKQMKARRLAR